MSELSTKINHFSLPIRIYYEDTDKGGIVYHANYAKFMERARTEWLRSLGYDQEVLATKEQLIFIVRSIQLEFLKPARFNDLLHVTVEVEEHKPSSLVFMQNIYRQNNNDIMEHVTSGRAKIVAISPQNLKPIGIPLTIREALSRDH